MKIIIVGGMGFEKELVSLFRDFSVVLIGGKYDLKKESFHRVDGCEFFSEFVTENYYEIFSGGDVFIDVSINNKSKYLTWNFTVYYKKICYILLFNDGWKIYKFDENGCLNCVKSYTSSLPYVLLPELESSKVICFFESEKVSLTGRENFCFDLTSGKKVEPDFSKCSSEHKNFDFMNGKMSDIVSVSCGENLVVVSPMNDVTIDLGRLKENLKNHVRILKENMFFLEFKVEKFNVQIFRHGRTVVKGTKEKNTALFIYYNYAGVV
jgi:hypothetical protein